MAEVGAFVGDTANYFAIRGIMKVIVTDPYPGAYEELVDIIRMNGLKGKIYLLSIAVRDKER
jgi:hypothetical protein